MAPPDGLPPNKRLPAILAISVAVGMATLDTAIANTALPTIAADLHAGEAASVWVVNAYQLAVIATLLPLAALGEIIGHRRVYVGGLALFTLTSLACALAWSLPSLAAARVLQGLGASAIVSVNTALIRFVYPQRLFGRGLGMNAMVVAVSFAVGPTVASAILAVASWPWLFAVNVPLGVIGVALAWPTLPETGRAKRRFDWVVAGLNVGGFSLLILGLGEAAHRDPPGPVLAELAAAFALFALLLRRQAGQAAPMLPVDLFRRPLFALSSATAVCAFAAQGLAFVSLPFLFETGFGRTAVETGLLMTPWPVVVAVMGPIAGPMSDRFKPALLCGLGLAVLAIGLALLATLPGQPGPVDIGWRMAVCGAGFGFYQAPNLKAIMSSAPPERSGGASGVVATSRLLGQTCGAALVALCFSLFAADGLGPAPAAGAPAAGAAPDLALALGAGFAAIASAVSFLRLLATDPTHPAQATGARNRPG